MDTSCGFSISDLKSSSKSSEFSCDKCSYITDKRSNLKRHNCQKCLQCEEFFVNTRQLAKHVSSVHGVLCSMCGREFKRMDNLNTHVKKVHRLTIGDGVLKNKIGYMKLSQVEKKCVKYSFTNNATICHICGYESLKKFNLDRHIKAYHKSV